jgi:pimeloyl-ACP methyl ester carboxylesterase
MPWKCGFFGAGERDEHDKPAYEWPESGIVMNARRAYTDGRFGQIHYCTCGEGKPLVLLHQSPTHMTHFDAVWQRLADGGHRIVGIDLPGFGNSDGPQEPVAIAEYAHIVPAVLDALGVQKADILGRLTGGLVATEAALQFPERIERIILHGPVPYVEADRERLAAFVEAERKLSPRPDGGHLKDHWDMRTAAQPGWTDIEAVHRHVVAWLAAWPNGWFTRAALLDYDHGKRMQQLTQPGLIISNTGDVLHSIVDRARELCPHLDYAQITGGTVDIVDEKPDEWSQVVLGWLEKRTV